MGGMLYWNCDGNKRKRKDRASNMSFTLERVLLRESKNLKAMLFLDSICERLSGGYERGEGVYGLTREGDASLCSCFDICSQARAKGGRSLSAPAAAERGRERGKERAGMHQCHRREGERLLSASHHSILHLHSRRWLLSGEPLLRLKCQSSLAVSSSWITHTSSTLM